MIFHCPVADASKKKLKSFLDPKVAQNLGIFLAGFKMDAEELKFRLAILSEDDGGLSAEQINILRRYAFHFQSSKQSNFIR